jgi:hypothetical protein
METQHIYSYGMQHNLYYSMPTIKNTKRYINDLLLYLMKFEKQK